MRHIVVVALVAIGCVESLGEETSTVGVVISDLPIVVDRAPADLGEPVAIDFADGALFIWPFATTANASGFATTANGVALNVDAAGALIPMLALNEEDAAEAAALGDGVELALFVSGGVATGSAGILFYEKHAFFPTGGSRRVSTGACSIDSTRTVCDRQAGAEQAGDAFAYNRSGIFASDGFAYVHRCTEPASLEQVCVLARFTPGEVFDPQAHRFFSAFEGWVDSESRASSAPEGLGKSSLQFNQHHDGYYFAQLDPFENSLAVRRALNPEGPYGNAMVVADLSEGPLFARGPLQLSSLSEDGGETLVFVVFADELRAVSFRFHDRVSQ